MKPSSYESSAFYPLTFPVTAGPGCLVVMLTLSAHTMDGGTRLAGRCWPVWG